LNQPGKTLLCLGATSDIGRAAAIAFAAQSWAVQLAGRDPEALRREADDIRARGATEVTVHAFDVLATDTFASFADGLPVLPDAVLCVIGLLGEQPRAESDLTHAAEVMRSNYEGPAQILGVFAERFAARGSGTIIGVSSVAGDRGRASNYIYGSAKAGLTAFLSGLRNRLASRGVHVLTVKPGFVRTRMTAGMKLPGPVTANPDEVGKAIFDGVARRKNVIYVRPVWFPIMTIIQHIPETIFKKMKL
jgi:short-subunit dehydrogenase